MHQKRVTVIGGGTGTFTVLQALRTLPFHVTAIVSTADDGGSAGILRDELGVLPPGDVRQALVALAEDSPVLRDLFSYRFTDGSLAGHSFGNLLLSALEKVTGRFDSAVIEAGKILAIKGEVLPVTTDRMRLRASTASGAVIEGEHAIEEYIWQEREEVQRIYLEDACAVHPLARSAVLEADLVVIAPGSVYTSLIPNLLVRGMPDALAKTKASIAYVANLMTEKGHAGEFSVQDFAGLIQSYAGPVLDYVVYNDRAPAKSLLERYRKEMERAPVRPDRRRPAAGLPYRLIGASLVNFRPPKLPEGMDKLAATRTLIRHDPIKLGRVLSALLYLEEAEKYLR